MTISVEIRMYDMGFGDAFRVTVNNEGEVWRMQVDCGSHTHNTGPGTETAVKTIIDDLADDALDGVPHLDVVVATHRHRDHISGFASNEWSRVHVDEVWLPYVEDEDDLRTRALMHQHENAASQLQALIASRRKNVALTSGAGVLDRAAAFAMNSSVNTRALHRLRDENGFAGHSNIRYLPSQNKEIETLPFGTVGVTAHILGPTDSPRWIKAMAPPKAAKWLKLNLSEPTASPRDRAVGDLFSESYVLDDDFVTAAEREAVESLDLDLVDDAGLLAAASVLERSVNNTSLFFVLEIDSRFRMLFPGDAQHGAWEDIYHRTDARQLVESVDFYKIGHHGSHNATPRWFAENWVAAGDAMLPWGLVKQWEHSIPHNKLISRLGERHAVVGFDGHVTAGGSPVRCAPSRGRLDRTAAWTQLTFELEA